MLERGYVAQDTSLESAAAELHLSRATFFRRLKRAVDRVVAVLAARNALEQDENGVQVPA